MQAVGNISPGQFWHSNAGLRKKLRCSGTLPCSLCLRSGVDCEYNAEYTRGKKTDIPLLDQREFTSPRSPSATKGQSLPNTNTRALNSAQPSLEQSVVSTDDRSLPATASPIHAQTGVADREATSYGMEIASTQELYNSRLSNPHLAALQGEETGAASSRTSPERDQTDLEGHYVGPSSGVSFLLRVQKRIHENVAVFSNGPIFNFGDAALPRHDPHFLVLPPKDEAKVLVHRYFDFAFPTHRFLHQPTVEAWLEAFYSGVHGPEIIMSQAIKALLLMVMAQGKQYIGDQDTLVAQSVKSNVYFAASENHLQSETGSVSLASIQARLAQCFYLLSESRVNHCWSLFGTTGRLALAIGLHRRWRREAIHDHVESECRKRVFWCAYSLDIYLSAALGRPKIFHDEDIDQVSYPVSRGVRNFSKSPKLLPTCASDSQITRSAILPNLSHGQNIMLAPVFHAKLVRVISGILKDLYGLQQKNVEAQTVIAQKYGADLADWRSGIGPFLETPNIELLQATYQRQYNVLNFAFAHAEILLYRPFLLRNLASLGRRSGIKHSQLQQDIQANIEKCLHAASRIVRLFKELCRSKKMYRFFWFTHYYVFCAIVILYVYVIQSRSASAQDLVQYLQMGEEAQNELSKCGTQTSFPQRYVVVLEELRKEAMRLMEQSSGRTETRDEPVEHHAKSGNPTTETTLSHQVIDASTYSDTFNNELGESTSAGWMTNFAQDHSPASYLADMTGWGEFDSLVLTGLGELSEMFPDNDGQY
ncbi:unnamed protein product [Penicillium olsonii]|uniref:Xylanolytic transcriptional activator regulatory domain-containing protein n=1 Tax=Penicillium olsonii TaxID=99116 RepID=A0A9W4HZM1_PENOL|nr:unnamed protein product [Penicillium olsonii]CAG8177252.1 unnamed protein product [Penicillium olsonii]